MKIRFLFVSIAVLFFTSAHSQTRPANIDVGSPNNSSECILVHGRDGSGVSHLLIAAKTPYPHAGHYLTPRI